MFSCLCGSVILFATLYCVNLSKYKGQRHLGFKNSILVIFRNNTGYPMFGFPRVILPIAPIITEFPVSCQFHCTSAFSRKNIRINIHKMLSIVLLHQYLALKILANLSTICWMILILARDSSESKQKHNHDNMHGLNL